MVCSGRGSGGSFNVAISGMQRSFGVSPGRRVEGSDGRECQDEHGLSLHRCPDSPLPSRLSPSRPPTLQTAQRSRLQPVVAAHTGRTSNESTHHVYHQAITDCFRTPQRSAVALNRVVLAEKQCKRYVKTCSRASLPPLIPNFLCVLVGAEVCNMLHASTLSSVGRTAREVDAIKRDIIVPRNMSQEFLKGPR